MLRQIYVRLRSLWRWRRQETDFEEEIRFHLAEEMKERIAAGMSPDEAQAAARRDFGNVPLIRELTRETWALAIVLLVGAGLLVRSWWQVEGVDPGFRPERVLAMQLGAPVLMTPAQRANFYRGVLERIESLPGVERAGFISDAFISSNPERTLTTERDGEAVSARLQFRSDEISAGLFQALGARLLDGRFFAPRDGPESPRVVIVNDALARRLWPGDDAVGPVLACHARGICATLRGVEHQRGSTARSLRPVGVLPCRHWQR